MYTKKEEREYFAKVLNELFHEKDITRKYFSDLTGISIHKIYNYLHGNTFPVPDDFHKLAEFFGHTVEDFWELTVPFDGR